MEDPTTATGVLLGLPDLEVLLDLEPKAIITISYRAILVVLEGTLTMVNNRATRMDSELVFKIGNSHPITVDLGRIKKRTTVVSDKKNKIVMEDLDSVNRM